MFSVLEKITEESEIVIRVKMNAVFVVTSAQF